MYATDGATPPLSSTTTVQITFTQDSKRKLPVWQPLNGIPIDDITNIRIPETASAGTVVATLTATLNGTVGYYISQDNLDVDALNVAGYFTSTPSSGNMSITVVDSGKFDASRTPTFYLRCRAYVRYLFVFIS